MTPSPPPDPSDYRLRRFLNHRFTRVITALIVVSLAGGGLWALFWIRVRLVPLIESNLEQLLGRPVEVGAVNQISLTGVRFGRSVLPATPTDTDRATIESVEVEFSPVQLLLQRTLQLEITLVQPNAYIEQADNGQWVSTSVQTQEGEGLIKTDLQAIRVRNGSVVLQPYVESGIPNPPITFRQFNGVARFLDDNQRIQFDVSGLAVDGGAVRVAGEHRPDTQQTALSVQGQNLLATDIRRLVDLPIALEAGRIDGNLALQLAPEERTEITGTATLRDVTATLENLPQPFSNTQGRLQLQGDVIAFENVRTRFGTVPVQVGGTIHLEAGYNLTAQVQSATANEILNSLNVDPPVPVTGTLQATLQVRGPLQQPVVQGEIQTLRTAQIDRVPFRSIQGQFQLTTAGSPRIILSSLRAIPQGGGQITGNGRVRLGQQPDLNLLFRTNQVSGDTIARLYEADPGIRVGDVTAIAQVSGAPANVRTVVQFQAPEATYPGRGELVIAGQRVQLRDAIFNVAGGTVQAQGQLVNGQIQATVNASQVALNQFSQDLRGRLNGTVQLTGNTAALNLENIQAVGQVTFSQGLAVISDPLTTQFRWNGQQLIVQQATAPGLRASGTVAVQTTGNTLQVGQMDLAVRARGYDLQDFNLDLPGNILLAGQADFTGQVTGTPGAPNAQGALQLRNLRVNGQAFDPVLAGRVNFRGGRQTNLNLIGQQVTGTPDQIALTLGPNNRPTSFLVRRDEAIARGQLEGENLLVNLQNIPVALLQTLLPGAVANLGPIAGNLSGDLTVDSGDFSVEGRVAIANPQVGGFRGDVFQGEISFADGVARLTGAELVQGDSRITLGGDFQLGGDRPVNVQITFNETPVQNLLQALNALPLGGVAPELPLPLRSGAAVLQPVEPSIAPLDVRNEPLITSLRRFSEIERLVAMQQLARAEAARTPELADLQGRVNGSVAVTGSLGTGLNVSFDLRGENWQWGTYDIGSVLAQGGFADGALTLQPLMVNTEGGVLAFRGQLGEQNLSGQLQASDLPLSLVQPFLAQFPLDLAGRLDATADLSGSLDNPRAIGQVSLENAMINDQPIQQADLNFRYADARFNFESNLLTTANSPAVVTGSVPIVLPFAAIQPVSDEILVRATVANEGLSLINLFTDQVTWLSGQGELNAIVTGTFNQPMLLGRLTLQNAALKAQALPDPLTNVTGLVQFDRDRIVVQSLQAQYNQQPVTAQGILPVSNPALVTDNPLTVSLNDLALNLPELYQGDVSGNVVVTGAAVAPEIGGWIRLADGEVRINQPEQSATANDQVDGMVNIEVNGTAEIEVPARGDRMPLPPISTPNADTGTASPLPIAFNDLQIVLADNVRVTLQPILSFTTEGDINLNGSLGDLRPQGLVRLTRGQINLFTTEFRLARGYEQTARFTPEGGLDPILDVRLVALVPETSGFRLQPGSNATEIAVPVAGNELGRIGTLRTVEVIASVTGPASELEQNLELTSSPSRSRAEIVALIGGTFVDALGQTDSLVGVANLAGNVLFRNFQGAITNLGQSIGLSELRIFPTLVSEAADEAAVLGLAVEAAVDVTGDLSVSVLQVFPGDQPTRYNLLYRVSDQIRVRGSTDLQGDSRATIEYEARF